MYFVCKLVLGRGTVLADLLKNPVPTPERCSFALLPEEQFLVDIYKLLPMEDKTNFAFTCKAFLPLLLLNRVDVKLGHKQRPQWDARLSGLAATAFCLKDARKLSKFQELRIFSSAKHAQRPEVLQWAELKHLLGHLHILRLHNVKFQLWLLEDVGIARQLQVLDCTGSTLETKYIRNEGDWWLLSSGSQNLKQLILRDARILVLDYMPDAPFNKVKLPQLRDLDISGFERVFDKEFSDDPEPEGVIKIVSPAFFRGCPRLTTVAYSQENATAEASPLAGCPALRAADIRLAPAVTAGPPKFPLKLTSLTLRGAEGKHLDITEALREADAAIGRGMDLQHLGCAHYKLAADLAYDLVLPGVSVLLDPVDATNKQARVSDGRLQALIGGVLKCTPDVERLELGACPSWLTVPASCARLSTLCIRRCPLGPKEISCAGLKDLAVSHSFKDCAVGSSRELETLELILAGSMMDCLESFTLGLTGHTVGDTCKISVAAPFGRSVHRALPHQTDVVGKWELSVGIQGQKAAAVEVPQPKDIILACVDAHGRAVWEVLSAGLA